MRADGGSAANEIIVTGGHVGTHVDALAHVSHDGSLFGGVDAASAQSHEGFRELGIDAFPPYVGRAVVLDVDSQKERISLGIKQVAGDPLDTMARFKKGDPVTCEVTSVQDGGIEVKITGTDLKADGNEVAVESIEIAHEGMEVENKP